MYFKSLNLTFAIALAFALNANVASAQDPSLTVLPCKYPQGYERSMFVLIAFFCPLGIGESAPTVTVVSSRYISSRAK